MKILSDRSFFSVPPPLVFGNKERRIYSTPHEPEISAIMLLMDHLDCRQPLYSNAMFRGRVGPRYRYRQENMPFFGMEYVREGNLAVRRMDRCYLLEPGDVFFLHLEEDCEVATGPEGFCVKDSLSIRGGQLESLLQAFGIYQKDVFFQFDWQRLDSLIDRLSNLAMKMDLEDQITNSALTYEILDVIAFSRRIPSRIPKLENLVNFMRSNLHRHLSLNELAAFAGTSKTTLLLAFREIFGKTPHQKLIDLRMEYAVGLLLTCQNLSVKEIADRCGYPNAMNFSSAFRKYYGIPPLQFRKEKISCSLFPLSGMRD